jgi:hypothetical protein
LLVLASQYIFAPLLVIASWCNGSTSVFGTACLGSNPGGVTLNQSEKQSESEVEHSDFLFISISFAPYKDARDLPIILVVVDG